MPPFPKPRFDYAYDLEHERAALRAYRRDKPGRQIPGKTKDTLLVATWNVANLGVQDRLDSDYALIAELISWFDLVAVQEVNDNLRGIEAIHARLPARYDLLFSDASGNRERQAFLFDTRKVKRLKEVGRVAIPPSQLPKIATTGTTTPFTGFDRGPYLASFESAACRFALLNVHLFYGSEAPADLDRRTLETFAVAWWAASFESAACRFALLNVHLFYGSEAPADLDRRTLDALVALGLQTPPHSSQVASAIASDNQFDQVAFFPGPTARRFTGQCNVFDFDGALFQDLWMSRTRAQFLSYVRYHLSDHRPLWLQLQTS
jgi:endonuclease/exonuclease/phosphatase family metal-dependent hydrolase